MCCPGWRRKRKTYRTILARTLSGTVGLQKVQGRLGRFGGTRPGLAASVCASRERSPPAKARSGRPTHPRGRTVGFGQRFLNRESPLLRYLTSAIFCYYVLHQTITVIAGYYLTQYRLGVVAESALVTAITVIGCVAGYELIRRIPGIGVLFGVHKVSGFHVRAPASGSNA